MARSVALQGFSFVLATMASLVLLSGEAAATTFTVGDNIGWTIPSSSNRMIDYAAWAAKHKFTVGDVLYFRYASGAHDVQPLPNQASFAACDVSAATVPALVGGSSRVSLKSAGTKYFVCGFGDHCRLGMKFKINVLARE